MGLLGRHVQRQNTVGRPAAALQVEGAEGLLAGEEQGRRGIGLVGVEVLLQDVARFLHGDPDDVVLVVVGEGLHLKGLLGDAPAAIVAVGHSAAVVQAVVDGGVAVVAGGDDEVSLAVLVTGLGGRVVHVVGVVAGVVVLAIAAGDEDRHQALCRLPEAVIRLAVVVVLRVLPDDGHIQAALLADGQAGQVPLLAVGVHDLRLVGRAVGRVGTPGVPFAGVLRRVLLRRVRRLEPGLVAPVGERLHQPDHPYLLGLNPGGVGRRPVNHAGREGCPSPPCVVGEHAQRHVGQQHALFGGRALGVRLPHRDAIRLQRCGVNHLVGVRPVDDVAELPTTGDGPVRIVEEGNVTAPIGQVDQSGVAESPFLAVISPH